VAVPLQLPLQPANVHPELADAARLTASPSCHTVLQLDGQWIAAGVLVMVPLPFTVTASVRAGTNVAATATSAVSVTEQVALPLQAPDQ